MITLFLTSTLITVAVTLSHPEMFYEWMEIYSKRYMSQQEMQYRFQIWVQNYEYIQNRNDDNGVQLEINKFSDLTKDEFNALYNNGYNQGRKNRNSLNYELLNMENISQKLDWRQYNVLSDVKDQGACGSSWAFATAGVLEATYAKQTNSVISLSVQQMIDCCKIENIGCNGGDPESTFKCIMKDGIMNEIDYPYRGLSNNQCNLNSDKIRFKPNKYILVIPQDPTQLKAALNIQPVTVCLNSDSEVFKHYKGGIIQEKDCTTTITHCVLAVGYGTDNQTGQDYWILKNSWGPEWGENGYFRLARQDNLFSVGTCGILKEPMFSQ